MLAVGEVLDVADALQLLGLHERLDPLDDLLRADQVGQLGDDDAHPARGELLDPGGGAGAEAAPAGEVGVADAVEPDDAPAAGQVGAGHEPHQVVERAVGVGDEVPGGADHLDQVVRGHVGGHADRDAGGAVDEQVGVGGRHHAGLGQRVVVVRHEVDGVLVEPGDHEQRGGRHPGLGVARGGRAVVERAEVAVPVDQRQAHRERLGHAHQGVVDRLVAVRVVLAHDLADDPAGLHVRAVGAQAQLAHPEQDAALHRLEAVAGVGQRARVDDAVGVLEEGAAHLLLDVDVDDPLGEVLGGRRRAAALGHGVGLGSGSIRVAGVPRRGSAPSSQTGMPHRLRHSEPPDVEHLVERAAPPGARRAGHPLGLGAQGDDAHEPAASRGCRAPRAPRRAARPAPRRTAPPGRRPRHRGA